MPAATRALAAPRQLDSPAAAASQTGTAILSYNATHCQIFPRSTRGYRARSVAAFFRHFLAIVPRGCPNNGCCLPVAIRSARQPSAAADRPPRHCGERVARMNFASDNTAGIAPEILEALVARQRRLRARLRQRRRDPARSSAGSARFSSARSRSSWCRPARPPTRWRSRHVSPPWGAVFVPREAHIVTDECGAPEFFGGGLKLIGLPGEGCKIDAPRRSPRRSRAMPATRRIRSMPSALSLTQATEAGTIYRPDEIAALAEIAHARGMTVHMDGARFANALVRLNASAGARRPGRPGVDVLSFGATKGGAHGGGGGGVLRSGARGRTWASGASAPGTSSPSIASWPRSSRPSCTTTAGCGSRATPTPWPTGWPPA